MIEVLRLNVLPNRHAFALISSSVNSFGRLCGLSEEQASKFVLATEEVFTYCAKIIEQEPRKLPIEMGFLLEGSFLQVTLEHFGADAALSQHFKPGSSGQLKRDSFEALGLYIAREVIDNIVFTNTLEGKSKFSLAIRCRVPQSVYRSLNDGKW